MPSLRYRLSIGRWTNFIAFNCQVEEWVLIFANPVFKKPGIFVFLVVTAAHTKIGAYDLNVAKSYGNYCRELGLFNFFWSGRND